MRLHYYKMIFVEGLLGVNIKKVMIVLPYLYILQHFVYTTLQCFKNFSG